MDAQFILLNTPLDIYAAAALISRNHIGPKASPVIKFILQSAFYLIWKERTIPIFTVVFTPSVGLCRVLGRLIRDRLISFPSNDLSPSLLQYYFS